MLERVRRLICQRITHLLYKEVYKDLVKISINYFTNIHKCTSIFHTSKFVVEGCAYRLRANPNVAVRES
jgi:hypothetical protein